MPLTRRHLFLATSALIAAPAAPARAEDEIAAHIRRAMALVERLREHGILEKMSDLYLYDAPTRALADVNWAGR